MQDYSQPTNYTENSTAMASCVLQTVFVSDDNIHAVVSPTENQEESVVTPVEAMGPFKPGWYEPDGMNRQLVNIQDKSVANFKSPGGGMGAMLVTLPQLSTFFDTDNFLIDLDTDEVFVLVKSEWRHVGLYCMNHLFELEQLWKSIEHNSAIMKWDLEQETQTSVV